ncbi:MAG: MFS transporter, partial [Opitutus sp.]|nr:MFS transporter [Opitutus sp.]
MKHFRLKLSLFLNYFLFASLLNSVGTVIFQVQRNFGVSPASASVLEACKDLSIAATSFFVAAWLLRIGYKRAMLAALGGIGAMCAAMPFLASFWAAKLLFVATGVSFGVMKVSVFATLGLVTDDAKEHASLMSFLESCFMLGVLAAYFLFGAFVDDAAPASTAWFRVYFVLAALAFAAAALLWTVPVDESRARAGGAAAGGGLRDLCALALSPLVLVFALSVFLYVLT